MVRDKIFNYGPGKSMLTPIDLPMVAHITQATRREPCLGLMLRLDTRSIALAVSTMKRSPSDEHGPSSPISIERLDPPLLEALHRLIELLDDPQLLPCLAPLIRQEIIFRLLTGRHGSHLRKFVAAESPSQQIARVAVWMKQNFTGTIPMDELAAKANLAKDAGAKAEVGTPADAARDSDALLLAVHWTRVDEVLGQAGTLSGKVLLTCSLPMSKDDSHMVVGHTTSGADALAAKVPGAHVVSAFSTVPSEVLLPIFEGRGKKSRRDLVYCGDDEGAKRSAAGLIRDVGFNPVDLGSLSFARYVEPFSLLVAAARTAPNWPYRFESFAK